MLTDAEYWSDPKAFEDLSFPQFLALIFKKLGEEHLRLALAIEPDDPLKGTTREQLEELAFEFVVLRLKRAAAMCSMSPRRSQTRI